MKRAGPALLIAVMLLSACAPGKPRQTHFHAIWLAEGPRTVRVLVGTAAGEPLYSVERRDVGQNALAGAGFGLLISSSIFGAKTSSATGECSQDCMVNIAAFIGGVAVIGGFLGAFGAPAETVRSLPIEDHEATRPLAPVMRQAGQDVVRRAAEMFAENLRQNGHAVALAEAGDAAAGMAESEISITISSIELIGPSQRNNTRASLRITIQVRARWRGSTHTQNFRYRSEAIGLEDWADPGGAVADQAVRQAVSNLSGRMFKALAEP